MFWISSISSTQHSHAYADSNNIYNDKCHDLINDNKTDFSALSKADLFWEFDLKTEQNEICIWSTIRKTNGIKYYSNTQTDRLTYRQENQDCTYILVFRKVCRLGIVGCDIQIAGASEVVCACALVVLVTGHSWWFGGVIGSVRLWAESRVARHRASTYVLSGPADY